MRKIVAVLIIARLFISALSVPVMACSATDPSIGLRTVPWFTRRLKRRKKKEEEE